MANFLLALLVLGILVAGAESGLRRRALAARGEWDTRTLPDPDPAAARIVVLGDSIAYGWGLPEAQAWPNLLAARLQSTYPRQRWQVFNAGIAGHTVADAYVRFDEHERLKRPHVVLIAFGLNDCRRVVRLNDARRMALFVRNETTWWGKSYLLRAVMNHLSPLPPITANEGPADAPRIPPAEFQRILVWMVSEARRMGTQPVLLTVAPLAPDLNDASRGEFSGWVEYNALVREVARASEVPFIELSHKLPGERGAATDPWLSDGVHLSAAGEAAVAERVWQGLHRPNIAAILRLPTQDSNAEMAPALE